MTPFPGTGLLVAIAIFAAAGLYPLPLSAQRPHGATASCVSFDLPAGHWGVEVVRRLDAAGIHRHQSADRTVPACLLGEALRVAGATVPTTSELGRLINGWEARFAEEFASSTAAHSGRPRAVAGVLGLESRGNAVAPGMGEYPPDRTGAIARADGEVAFGMVEVAWPLLRGVDVAARGGLQPQGGVGFERIEAVGDAGPIVVRAGRGEVGYGPAVGGGIVLTGGSPIDRIGLATPGPGRLPGPLRGIGEISFSTFLASLGGDRHERRPFFWGAAGSVIPHPRLTLSVQRAAMFGGEGYPLSVEDALNMLIGRVAGIGFEDQIVSVGATFRLPTEAVIPVLLLLEWGAEDAAGAWWSVPGRVVGLYLPFLPMLPELSLGLEVAHFAPSCCWNPKWYRHWAFPGSWALGDEPLGHPLGGHGSEFLLFGRASLHEGRTWLDARFRTRHRGEENLFVPGRAGRGTGAEFQVARRFFDRFEAEARFSGEAGKDWSERSASVRARLRF